MKKVKARTKNRSDSNPHPNHNVHIKRLHRVQGQLEGIERMIVDRRYCPEILTQLHAAHSAIRAIESAIFESHLKGCVSTAFNSKDPAQNEIKIKEILKLVY